MASYEWSVTTSWAEYGPSGPAKLNIENQTGAMVRYATGTSAPSAGFGGGRLRDQDGLLPVDLKASERLYLKASVATKIFGQDAT